MLLYTMLRRFGRPQTLAFSAALILATMASYWSNARGVGEDSLLTLGVTTALLAFYQAVRPDRQGSSVGAWALFTAGMVIATLSKGVLGLAIPATRASVEPCSSWLPRAKKNNRPASRSSREAGRVMECGYQGRRTVRGNGHCNGLVSVGVSEYFVNE
jgi:4-amino-4-deoxy-L-arabinose transferase-like glycosyltransferase